MATSIKVPVLHRKRNLVALNPLLRKGGIHQDVDIDIARQRERRQEKQRLAKTDWLKGD